MKLLTVHHLSQGRDLYTSEVPHAVLLSSDAFLKLTALDVGGTGTVSIHRGQSVAFQTGPPSFNNQQEDTQ